ncbi:MAG: TolC family protein [bacterium]|jgi:outer membrane protein TolC
MTAICAFAAVYSAALCARPAVAGEAVRIERAGREIRNAFSGQGAPVGKLAALEEEARGRVREILERPGFLVSDPSGVYIPSPLGKLMAMTVAKNPELALMRSDVAVMEEQARQMGAYMDPMVGLMLGNMMVQWPWEQMEPMTMQELKFQQSFMSYGKRSSMKKIAGYDVKLAEIAVKEAEYNMSGDVIDMYYDLLANAVNIEMLDKRKALLEIMLEIARARYELGLAPMSDVLSTQKMISMVDAMRAEMEEMRGTMTAKLAGMIGIPDGELELELEAAEGDAFAADADAESLWFEAYKLHPELAWLTVWDAQLAEKEKLAEKNYHPDYTIEAGYGFRQNFADMFSLGVMFNLPIYQRDKQDAAFKEAAAMREQVPLKEQALLNRIRRDGGAELARLRLIGARIDRYKNELIPLAETSFDATLAGYQVGKAMFADLLMTQIDLVDYETEHRLALVERARARSKLYYITLGAVADAMAPNREEVDDTE